MAEVPQVYLNCAVYLYANEQEASSGKAGGGTAFVIQIPLSVEGWFQWYVVTAAHIIKDATVGDGPVVRINADEGGYQMIRTSHDSWRVEEKDDLAIMPLEVQSKGLNVGVIPLEAFLTKEMIEQHKFGPGNEVFVTGRFVHHEGKTRNTPTVRFGNISMMPEEPFKRPSPEDDLEEAFLVEFRSVGGYSGSPVFLCEVPFHLRARGTHLQIWSFGPHLLGVDIGHVHEHKRVLRKTSKGKPEEDPIEKYYEANTAMSIVVPAWKLLDFLNREDIVLLRRSEEGKIIAEHPTQTEQESSISLDLGRPDSNDSELFMQSDFEEALGKASRRVPTSQSGAERK
jgi:hypothetical protein